MLTSAQCFFNYQAANTTGGPKQQDMHRIRGQSGTMVSRELSVRDRKPGMWLCVDAQRPEHANEMQVVIRKSVVSSIT